MLSWPTYYTLQILKVPLPLVLIKGIEITEAL
jgi:hypothetical protein